MNIIKEMLNLPDTPSGKKKLNKLITKLGLGKKQKGDILKNVVSGDIGGGGNEDVLKVSYYIVNTRDGEEMILSTLRSICIFYNMFGYKFLEGGTDEYVRKFNAMQEHCIASDNKKYNIAFEFVVKFATFEAENIKANSLEELINGMAMGDEDAYNALMTHIERVDKETFYKYIKENGYFEN